VKVLLDENLPHDFRHFLPGHKVRTVAYQRWQGVQNGDLLARAAADGFDVLVTIDSGIRYQQNLVTLPLAVLALEAENNKLTSLMPLVPAVLEALATLPPRAVTRVG
jgi:predicted nuclease of predicted toxin-antitoxin system